MQINMDEDNFNEAKAYYYYAKKDKLNVIVILF